MFLGRLEIEHKVEHHLLHLVGAAVGLVHFVYHHNGLETYLYGLLQHETRLGHRALEGVDKQQTAVGHVEHALHLSAEVGVSRGVDYVDFGALIVDGNVFRKDCYATLALQVVVVEDEVACGGVVAEQVSGFEHVVDQCGFTVVDMSDNGNIANILHRNLPNCISTRKVNDFLKFEQEKPTQANNKYSDEKYFLVKRIWNSKNIGIIIYLHLEILVKAFLKLYILKYTLVIYESRLEYNYY